MSSKTKTTATKEEVKPALVPKLRFPGFSDPWDYEPLSKVLKERKLKNTDGRDVFSISMEYGIVNQIELLGHSFAAANTSHYTVGRRYDVVYTKSPLKAFPFGIVKQCKFDGEVALSPLYGVFTPPNPHLGLMIEAYFESANRSKNFLSPLCQKGAKNTLQITNTTFLTGRLPFPTQPAEQQQIAECLSSADELMAAQARKVDSLETHKKGLMQQLFPREGETQPRLRFPEFQNAGEWEERKLGTVRDIQGGKFSHRPCNDPRFFGGQYPFIQTGDVVKSEGGAVVASQSLNEEGFLELIMRGQKEYLNKVATTGAQKNINNEILHEVGVLLPSVPEQQRIASCLSRLDSLIIAETQKLEALKTHKRGLMQQIFPSCDSDHLH